MAYKKAIENYDPSVWENKIANDPKPPQSGYSYFLKDIFEEEKGNHIKENGKVAVMHFSKSFLSLNVFSFLCIILKALQM